VKVGRWLVLIRNQYSEVLMKKLVLGMIALTFLASCNQSGEQGMGGGKGMKSSISLTELNSIPNADLTDAQEDGLVYMLEEEKMARDVYLTFNSMYGQKVFSNISGSEQKHMDSVNQLVIKYNLNFSVSPQVGYFYNNELQTTYNQLIARGSTSLKAALEVGRDIELIDIADLQRELQNVPADLTLVYQNLLNASYNHLSAFERNLSN